MREDKENLFEDLIHQYIRSDDYADLPQPVYQGEGVLKTKFSENDRQKQAEQLIREYLEYMREYEASLLTT